MSKVLVTPVARGSYLQVFTPKAFDNDSGGKAKYSVTLIFDEEAQKTPEFKTLVSAVQACIRDKWGDKRPQNLRSPFRKGEEKDSEGFGPGKVFINASTEQKPNVVSSRRGPDGALAQLTSPSDLVSGDYIRCSVRPFAYDQKGNRGVAFGLNNVQFVKKGQPLGGRTRADDDFADTVDTGANDSDLDDLLGGSSQTGGRAEDLDDGIPF